MASGGVASWVLLLALVAGVIVSVWVGRLEQRAECPHDWDPEAWRAWRARVARAHRARRAEWAVSSWGVLRRVGRSIARSLQRRHRRSPRTQVYGCAAAQLQSALDAHDGRMWS